MVDEFVPASKRRRGDDGNAVPLNDALMTNGGSVGSSGTAIQKYSSTSHNNNNNNTTTSTLPSPTIQLSGHTGSIYSLQYSPNGATLCSTSFDKTCFLWQHCPLDEFDDDYDYDEYDFKYASSSQNINSNVATYKNFHVLQGHTNAILDCTWFHNDNHTVVTASADNTIMLWDIVSQQRLKKYTNKSHHHTGIVNAVAAINEYIFVSVSDDKSIIITDRRSKYPTATYSTNYPVLAVATGKDGMCSSNSSSDYQIYTSGIDPTIHVWDIRQQERNNNTNNQQKSMEQLHGHTDTVTSLSMNSAGTHLLSNSMDQSLIQWDVRPFVAPKQSLSYANHHEHPRIVQTFRGHAHSTEKGLLKCSWSSDGSLVSAGSTDHHVHIWDVQSGQELYCLSGHKGCVYAVTFHTTETNIIASGSSDQQIFVGELTA